LLPVRGPYARNSQLPTVTTCAACAVDVDFTYAKVTMTIGIGHAINN
jgi:hypothetical protein